MGFGESFVEPGAFLQFLFIKRLSMDQGIGSFAAFGAHRVDVKSDSGRATDRERGVAFIVLHRFIMAVISISCY